jgi:putative acetyltransferase
MNASEIQYRQVAPSDNRALAAMIRAVFDEHGAPHKGTVYSDPTTDDLYSLFRAPKAVLWIAEENGEVLGCCGVYPTEGLPQGYAELVKFYLAAKARGQGIGKTLMEKSIASARQLGYSDLYLESLPKFAKAVSLYEKQGFQKIDHPLGNSGHTTCNIWMIRKL